MHHEGWLVTRTAILGVFTLIGLWATFFHADSLAARVLDIAVTATFAWFTYRAWRLYQRVAARGTPTDPSLSAKRQGVGSRRKGQEPTPPPSGMPVWRTLRGCG